jgi:hypothetical protein
MKHTITHLKLAFQRAEKIGSIKCYIFVILDLSILSLCAGSIINSTVGGFFFSNRSINIQRLHRANSFIRVRKESAGKLLKQKDIG